MWIEALISTTNSFTTPRQDRTMDAPNEKEQVFHPSSIPVDRDTKQRKQREERQQSVRSCLNVCVIISALSSAFIVIGAGYLINKGLQSFLFPTKPFALKPRHVDRSNASQVHPLIDATTTFDIHATVWQDVTDLLAQGDHLPARNTPWDFVDYQLKHRSAGGFSLDENRTEVILWSGVVARKAKLDSKIHTAVPLHIPVAPLYTANLGPSSLRATFSVAIPEGEAEKFGSFRNYSSIYTSDSPILPRRPTFAEYDPVRDLNTALADFGISTSLLELVPSPWYRTTSDGGAAGPTVHLQRDLTVSPFFSAHRNNLRFLEPTSDEYNNTEPRHLPEFRDHSGRILLPHIRTRSRLGMVRTTEAFPNSTFQREHRAGRFFYKELCKNSVDWPCSRNYMKHVFETMLTFAKVSETKTGMSATNSSEPSLTDRFYYAPTLTQVSSPGAPVHQRRIPRHMPDVATLRDFGTLRSNASAECEIPSARLDAKQGYFKLDWEIYFSAHSLQRVLPAENAFTTLERPEPAPLGPGEEGTRELFANSVSDVDSMMKIDRFATGDRLHAKDHPTVWLIINGLSMVWQMPIIIMLRFVYWYTRKTSAGLWIEAQWLLIAFQLSNFAVGLVKPFATKVSDPYPSFFGLVLALAGIVHVPYAVATLLHLERPAGYDSAPWWKRNPLSFRRHRLTRREKKSIALAGTIDRTPFLIAFSFALVLHSVAHRPFILLRPAGVCLTDDTMRRASVPLFEKIFSRATWAINSSLAEVSLLGQTWFNHRARTFTGKFRISAVGTAITSTLLVAWYATETLRSWPDANHTPGFNLLDVFRLVSALWSCYQALTCMAVPQVEPVDDDEE